VKNQSYDQRQAGMWCGEDENKTAADKKRDEMCEMCLQSVWSTKLRDLILKLPDLELFCFRFELEVSD
jgi:hypothetical protein